MTKKITQIKKNDITYTFLGLPNSNIFKYEVVQKLGSLIEKNSSFYFPTIKKEIFGISHLIEHMCFKHSKNYTSDEIIHKLKKYGRYNASTSHDRVNYWYQSTNEHIHTTIDLVNEIAFNDLTKVPENEFLMERDTVYNECKRYMDDDHSFFHFTSNSRSFGLKDNDNVLGSLENISSLTLEDIIEVKKLFNMEGEQTINITFDNNLLTPNEIIDLIEKSLSNKNIVFTPRDETKINYYKSQLPKLLKGELSIPCESEQILYNNMFEIDGFDRLTINYAKNFLSNFSPTSLFDEVREKRGLTYGIHFGLDRMAYKDYWGISCDITKGNEEKLVEAIKISCEETLKNFSLEQYNEFIETLKINRSIQNLNLSVYERLLWDFNEINILREDNEISKTLKTDIDLAFNKIDEHVTFENMKKVLEIINHNIKNNKGIISWSTNS